jgi:hypothetical protein
MITSVIDLVNKSNHNRESSMECYLKLQKVAAACGTATPNLQHCRIGRWHSNHESQFWFDLSIKATSILIMQSLDTSIQHRTYSIAQIGERLGFSPWSSWIGEEGREATPPKSCSGGQWSTRALATSAALSRHSAEGAATARRCGRAWERERGSALGEWEERGETVTVAQWSKGKRMGPLVTAVAAQSPGEIQNVALPWPIRGTTAVAEPPDLAYFWRHLSFTRH